MCQAPTAPQQVHISFANVSSITGDNAIGISWVTRVNTLSVVQYGISTGKYSSQASGFTHTYTQGGWKGIIHDVILNDLSPDTKYFYVVGDPSTSWSQEYSFVTKPPVTASINVLVLGDIATTTNTKVVLQATSTKLTYSLALVAGDLSYANGDNSTWDTYFNLIQPQAANTFWMSAIGNHEYGLDFNGIPYYNRVIFPNNEAWYGFNYGPVHILSFSTEHPTGITSEQYSYIENDLKVASANRAKVPFIITMGHKPIYTTNNAHAPDLVVRANIEPLLLRYGVDIAIWGHNHCYERSYPMQNSTPNNTRTGSASQPYNTPQAPIHITVGTGGKELYTSWATKASWSYYREAVYGYASFTATNKDLLWQFVRTDGSVPDSFYILKN